MKTFIHHDGALGDVLLSLPVLAAVRQESKVIHFCGRTDIGVLLRACGLADETSSAGAARYAALFTGPMVASDFTDLCSFDCAVLFTAVPASPLATSLASLITDVKIIRTIPPADRVMHVADFRASQYGAGLSADCCVLPVPRALNVLAGDLLAKSGYDGSRPLVAIHPGSGGKAKRWPPDRFFELIEMLQASALDPFVLLMTGPAEEDGVKARVDEFTRKREHVAHLSDAELSSIAALLGRCRLAVVNDSGIGHLAAASGCAVLSLFGPTNPDHWRPRGRRVRVVAAKSLAELEADQVYAEVVELLTGGIA